MKKRIAFVLVAIILLTSICFLMFNSCDDKVELNDFVTNRTEKQPLLDRFSLLEDFESCLWQSAVISNRSFDIGPTSYWMQGYIVLNKEQFKDFKENYDWKEKDLIVNNEKFSLKNGKSVPEIDLNLDDCNWTYSDKFNEKILGNFIGEFYLDLNNKVLFFDVESN